MPPDPVEADARRQLYVSGGFLLAAFVLWLLPVGAQDNLASSMRVSVLRPFLGLNELVLAARQRTLDVQVLQARLDSATARLVARSTLEEENRRLRALLGLSERAEAPWRAAQVLRPGTQGSEGIFLLNLGADDGVPPRAPILTREGLGGVLREVRPGSAIGMDWTHPDFRASAMSRDGAVYGMIESRRGLFREEDRLLLTGTPYHTRLDPGAEIVTAGTGGIFPRGIPIGRVVELAEEEGGWITAYWVQPYVLPGDMDQVLVVTPPDSAAMLADGAVIWPEGETGTRPDRWARETARIDSLAALRARVEALRDSVARLRGGNRSSGGAQ
ncbi:MAG: rod shape-determining protein MreC [Gemmatimonadetes bacterium]|nr:rod shape-determining protein MreC [Gemmatimonadota bacterium]